MISVDCVCDGKEEFLWGAMSYRKEKLESGEVKEESIPPTYTYEDLKHAFNAGIMYQLIHQSACVSND